MSEDGYTFERCYVEVVEKMLQARSRKPGNIHTVPNLCKYLFPEMKKPDNKWQGYKKNQKRTGKPIRVTVEVLYDTADFFGYEHFDFFKKIMEAFLNTQERQKRHIDNKSSKRNGTDNK